MAASAAAQAPPDRTEPPRLAAQPRLTLPAVQERALGNGLRVLLLEAHDVPLAQVNLVVHAGSAADPAGGFGVASFTAAMLDEGAGERTALEIADAVEFLGAELSTSSTFDASAVRLNVPTQRLEQALPIMADVALRPTFPVEELERLRQERLTCTGPRTVSARMRSARQPRSRLSRPSNCVRSTRQTTGRATPA
jgi:zinc protease